MKTYFTGACFIVTFFACNAKKDYEKILNNSQLYSKAVHELNSVVMGNNFNPIVASRNYTYANIAAYEVIAAGYHEKFNSLTQQIKGFTTVPKLSTGKNINYEFASLLAFCIIGESVTFPKGSMEHFTDSIKRLVWHAIESV